MGSKSAGAPKYLFFVPWPVKAGTGVNNVIAGLSDSMRKDYQPVIVVTGWQETLTDQQWLKLPAPFFGWRSSVGFVLTLIPNLLRLREAARGAVAANPHYFGLEILPLALLRKLGVLPKLILSVHGADVASIRTSSWIVRKLYSRICVTADVVVACSHALAAEVKQISPQANVVPVWNGISSRPLESGERPIRVPYLVSVASFVKKKGHDVLLRAFRSIAPEFPDLRLVLIGGKGPEVRSVQELVEELGLRERVELLVDVPHDEVWNWVGHAECFVHAAREEPFGIAVLEAALVKTPVVTTAVGGIGEYLTNEVDGLSCPPDDPDRFAALMRRALLDRAGARQRADVFFGKAASFTWDSAWAGYKKAARLGEWDESGKRQSIQLPAR